MADYLKDIWNDLRRADVRLKDALSNSFDDRDRPLTAQLIEMTTHLTNAIQCLNKLRSNSTETAIIRPRLIVTRPADGTYPRFHWEEDRLIKVGWLKEGREFRHTCHLNDVDWIVARLAAAGRDGRLFRIGRALRRMGSDDPMLKNHQKYTTIDWLKDCGLILKDDDGNFMLGKTSDLASEVMSRRMINQSQPSPCTTGTH